MTKQKRPAVSDRPFQIDLFGAASSPVLPRAGLPTDESAHPAHGLRW